MDAGHVQKGDPEEMRAAWNSQMESKPIEAQLRDGGAESLFTQYILDRSADFSNTDAKKSGFFLPGGK